MIVSVYPQHYDFPRFSLWLRATHQIIKSLIAAPDPTVRQDVAAGGRPVLPGARAKEAACHGGAGAVWRSCFGTVVAHAEVSYDNGYGWFWLRLIDV